GKVSVLPTPAFFYGLQPGEEISVEIEEGKVLIIRLVNIGDPDKDGRRTVNYELNGIAREVLITDKSVTKQSKTRAKADIADPLQEAAPCPVLIFTLSAPVGHKVPTCVRLFMKASMKMQSSVYAGDDGIVAEIHAPVR